MQYFRADHCSSLEGLDGGTYLSQTHCIKIRFSPGVNNSLDPYLFNARKRSNPGMLVSNRKLRHMAKATTTWMAGRKRKD
jgi:hypothetical protein